MKNIFILPTDKPSKVAYYGKELKYSKTNPVQLFTETQDWKLQNIYITSDEEIKEGDWYYDDGDVNFICKAFKHTTQQYHREKIILTTHPDLIKDGVQAIDDTFLEWFVNNPSCEFVKFKNKSRCCGRCNGVDDLCYTDMTCDKHQQNGCEECYGKRVEYEIIIPQEEPKQETLEEATRKYLKNCKESIHDNIMFIQGANFGAKWQAERMYSEEEVHEIILSYQNNVENSPNHITYNEWFEQFKKK